MFFNQETKVLQQKALLERTIEALRQPNADIVQIINTAYKHTEHADRGQLYRKLSREFHSDKNMECAKNEEIQQKLNNMRSACQSISTYITKVIVPLIKTSETSSETPENFEDHIKNIHTMAESMQVFLGPKSLVFTKHHEYPKPFNDVVGWIAFAISLSLSLTWLATAFILPFPLTISNALLSIINNQFIAALDPTYQERATKIKELNFEKDISLAETGEPIHTLSEEELRINFNQRFHRESEQTLDDNFYTQYLNSILFESTDMTHLQNFLKGNTRGIHNQNTDEYDANLHMDNIPLEDLYAYVRENEINVINAVPVSTYQSLCLILGTYQHLLSTPEDFHEKTFQEQATHALKQSLLLMTLSIVYLPMALSNLLIDNLKEAYIFMLTTTAWHTKLASAYLLSSPLYLMEALSPASKDTAAIGQKEPSEINAEEEIYSLDMMGIN